MLKSIIHSLGLSVLLLTASATQAEEPKTLPGTRLLRESQPLDEVMISGINRFCDRAIKNSSLYRDRLWTPGYDSTKSDESLNSIWMMENVNVKPTAVSSDPLKEDTKKKYLEEISRKRKRFQKLIGAVDDRVKSPELELMTTVDSGSLIGKGAGYEIHSVRWPVTEELTAEGLYLKPDKPPVARMVVVPDADFTPEMMAGLQEGISPQEQLARRFAQNGCEVLVPAILSRNHEFSGNPDVAYTNQPHREYIYRMAYVMGRSVIGYEVEKILSAIDFFESRNKKENAHLPLGVAGISEGGLLAFYAAALDPRIDASYISGYFKRRENLSKEPIYRNVWGLLTEFGDAEIAGLVAPRKLTIEACSIREVPGPVPAPVQGRRAGAAPGEIFTNTTGEVRTEFDRAENYYKRLKALENFNFFASYDGSGEPGSVDAMNSFFQGLTGLEGAMSNGTAPEKTGTPVPDPLTREKRMLDEMVRYSQKLINRSEKVRDKLWSKADATSEESWNKTSEAYREMIWKELIGQFPKATLPFNARSRLTLDEKEYWGYEIVLDVFPDVIASGILLVPKNLRSGEKRPVVVCQHGLEGTPMDTISDNPDSYKYYRAFAAQLVKRGFIVFSPQNPYRGGDQFRMIQRKSNPLKRTLFSHIIAQHAQILDWLASLSFVDENRMAFYGLSYGGKTAVHVPPFLDRYCLSICSGDYNEWIKKLSSDTLPMSYIFTGEYEIWMWDMGNLANHAELAKLVSPRPFMVERGHRDGVGIDEMVAWEYAKVRRHYDEMGIGDQTEIEYFNGPHRINAVGTFHFLHKHLNWPVPESPNNQNQK